MKLCVNVIALSLACVVSVKSDTSYLPPPASGGPYPAASSTPAAAPYPASGWKPTGQPFSLPPRQNPYSSQTSPQQFYGSPKATRYPTDVEFTTVEPVTSPRPEPESENLNEFAAEERIPDSGLYYVLLPDGRLQKVTYVTMPLGETVGKFQVEPRTSKVQNVHGYSANIKYQDVEPIRGPIYAYNPAPLIRIFK